MADQKISALTELTTPAATDELVIVDKSDTTMAAEGTDKRIKWSTVEGAMIPETIVDAKGDLIVATAADTVARKAAGADGAVLTAKAAESDGVLWKAPTALGPYSPQGVYNLPASIGGTANHLYLVPVFIPEYVTLTGVRFKVGITSTGNCKSVLYTGDGQTKAANSGATAVAASNTVQSVAFGSVTVQHAGTYWAGIALSAGASIVGCASTEYLGPAIDLASSYTTLPTTITPPASTSQSALALNPWIQAY